jgi:pimeloyl-ACP methyl ester carboxylesterase
VACAVLLIAVPACGPDESGPPPVGSQAHDAEGLEFTADDGTQLQGLLFGAGAGDQPVIVMAHQRGSNKDSWTDLAVAAAERGFAAFPFDFRGYGAGGGERDRNLDADLEAAVALMRDRGYPQVFVVGASMGGTAALVVAGAEDLDGVAALSAPARFAGMEVQPDRIDEPVMVVSAADDHPYAEDAAMFDERIASSLAVTVDGDAHGTGLFAASPKLERQLLDYFAKIAPPSA